ncbi:ABC transporter ATP-binding protein [Gemelliphila palaticanis]|uniref:ATP-binding cassette domain-containing protein n=1 Tax=Gemelliphila palaticanis TaxID=81950 RepID=A0ABX2T0F6_9BACL|nr:ATP-binding cassette domain-containing protein [Gemella palaticanis]MBF0714929.1 ATP-binding cassette domain-containing protein [Gemella palaticanis]NYS46859.1 ATP-binding cassette domain-containing protein [Gemella palaticanis]
MINIVEINKTFNKNTVKEHKAIDNLSLKIEEGDFVVIVGGNGAGKSTLLNSLAGDFIVDSGKIEISETDVTKLANYKRAKYISRVFQDPMKGTSPRMTILENLAISSRRCRKSTLKFGMNKSSVDYFINQLSILNLGLENRIHTEIGALSGGQRQAISLLMATMTNPKLLLLDEHTAALDPQMQKRIMELTDRIVKEKKLTTLMITHNLKDAIKYGNKLIILSNGKVAKLINEHEKEKLTSSELYKMMEELN